jgi:hypothetical protein
VILATAKTTATTKTTDKHAVISCMAAYTHDCSSSCGITAPPFPLDVMLGLPTTNFNQVTIYTCTVITSINSTLIFLITFYYGNEAVASGC